MDKCSSEQWFHKSNVILFYLFNLFIITGQAALPMRPGGE